jgi:hypothetical protein
MQDHVEILRVERSTRCACGEGLNAGERAGRLSGEPALLCLWCLADLQAGRRRPRRRRVDTPWPPPPTAPPVVRRDARHRARRATSARRPRGSVIVPLTVALLVVASALYVRVSVFGTPTAGVVAAGVPVPGNDIPSWVNGARLTGPGPRDTTSIWPPAPPDARARPLGTPGPSVSSSTAYVFMGTIAGAGGQPVSWDPCRPIHLVVNSAEAPPGADKLLREAADAVSSATGLQFVFEGSTTETPTTKRPQIATSTYGNRWSPVLVAWTDPSVVTRLAGEVAGLAGPSGAPYYTATQNHWVSGSVNLDGPDFRTILRRPDGWASARAIVMHEFGHLVGLRHVNDPDQLMYPTNLGQREFGAGDREGLRRLGLGSCFTT